MRAAESLRKYDSVLNDRDCELSERRQYAGGTLLIGQGLYTSLSRLLRFQSWGQGWRHHVVNSS